MTVGEMCDRMTAEEFAHWIGLFTLERDERLQAELARESDAAMSRMQTRSFGRQ